MAQEIKEPKDLGVKIGTKRRKFFEDIKGKMQEELDNCKLTAEMDEAFIKVIKTMIDTEKEKFK